MGGLAVAGCGAGGASVGGYERGPRPAVAAAAQGWEGIGGSGAARACCGSVDVSSGSHGSW
ncbi:MAG: hypothetical protein GY772_08875 [bacterium]|nr:hypothetical protein [bacterium]